MVSHRNGPVLGSEASEAKLQLASVRFLINTVRTVDIADIMLATIFEELEAGPKTSEELFRRIRAAWMGTSITRTMVDATLDAARERRFVEVILQLDGGTSYGLATIGRDELELSKVWANDVMDRAAAQIHLHARHAFAKTETETALRWTTILFGVLMWGIANAFTDGGGITLIDDRFLFPETYDLLAMDRKLSESCKDPEVLAFLKSELRSALDPSIDFATELVHYVSTGYVLYAYLGHRDHTEARARVGTLTNETVILDTPILVHLLSNEGVGRSTIEILKIAHQQGVKLLVEPSTIDEYRRVIDSRTEEALEIERAIRSGADLGTLQSTINDQILSPWINSHGQMLRWDEFQSRAHSVQPLLQSIGVNCSGSSHWTDELSGHQASLRAALEVELAARGGGRGELQLDHDAHLLAVAKGERDLNPESPAKIWPGAVIITSDTHMNATYSEVFEPNQFPVALTIGQWAGLLGCFSPPINAEQLAFALTEEIPRRTILKGAIQIPTETAIELARSITGQDISAPAMEDLQISLQELLEKSPKPLSLSPEAARDLARQALAQHSRRSNRVSKELIEMNRVEHERQIERLEQEIDIVRSGGPSYGFEEWERENTRLKDVSKRLGRGLCVAIIVILVSITIFILRSQNLEPGNRFGLSIVGFVIFIGVGFDFAIHIERKWYEPLGGVLVAAALAVLPIVI